MVNDILELFEKLERIGFVIDEHIEYISYGGDPFPMTDEQYSLICSSNDIEYIYIPETGCLFINGKDFNLEKFEDFENYVLDKHKSEFRKLKIEKLLNG